MNFHNNHVWVEENPHAITETNYQHQFSVNVWVGIVGDFLIGPHFLPPRLNGQEYRNFLESILSGLLECPTGSKKSNVVYAGWGSTPL